MLLPWQLHFSDAKCEFGYECLHRAIELNINQTDSPFAGVET